MRIRITRRFLIPALGGLVVLAALAVAVGLAGAAGVQDAGPCPASWFPLNQQPEAIQQQCLQNRIQYHLDAIATAQARPKTNVPPPTPDQRFPGVPLNTIPQWATLIQPDGQGLQSIRGLPQNITSVWDVGAVQSPTGMGYGVIRVYAIGPNDRSGMAPDIPQPQIARLFSEMDSGMVNLGPQYDQTWVCPRAIGALTITAIAGQTGLVSFTSTSGVSGTLDMATAAWTFGQ